MQRDNIFRYLEQISAPYLVLLTFLAIVAVFAVISKEKLRWLAFIPLLYFASIARPEALPWWNITMSQPLQTFSSYSRILTMAVLHILAVGLIFSPRGYRKQLMTPAVIALFVLEMAFSLKLVASGVTLRGILSGYTFTLVFITFVYGMGNMLKSVDDCYRVLQVYVAVVALIVLGTLYEVVFHRSGVIAGGRLFATAANPQAAGTIFAFALPAIAAVLSQKKSNKLMKPVLIALAGIVGVFLLWTGSRTGALAAVVGCAVLFRSKLTYTAVILGVIAICTYGLMQMTAFEGSHDAASRLLSTKNTRAEPWSTLIADFLKNPIFGKTLTGGSTRESSILGTASNLGIVGLAILGVFLAYIGKLFFQLISISKRIPECATLANAIAGTLAAMFVSWVLDGYLYGVTTIHIFFLYAYLTVGACLVEMAAYASQPVPLTWYNMQQRPIYHQ